MILLNFDMEEFDLPSEHNVNLPLDEQMEYSKEGSIIVLDLLEKYQIKATFFCTAVFALNARELILDIIQRGHEVASHGYSHSSFDEDDLRRSKELLEEITGTPIKGYRRALMRETDMQAIANAGYIYDSSVNPTFIPWRYNNLNLSRTCFPDHGVLEIPASVSPLARIPLFWLSMHNLPFAFYSFLCRRTLKRDGYLNIYFHPWEFSSHLNDKRLQIPYFVRKNSGTALLNRLERLIQNFLFKGECFQSIAYFVDEWQHSKEVKE